ncbi:hypothetical protein MTR67_004001 [Solanum verrucosum]|uniref:Uncharacterized protein n=1 Tax=Solanum verrucosum TaxID=315347 RepID=A0AAF0PY20_SOLVR|nr:hypothetical protein MTR67_004001 [Solanum verrucosum]
MMSSTIDEYGWIPIDNSSAAFGGGRTIRPGEVLESAEEKAAKEARTRELLAAYKSRVGLTIDPNLKLECEKALKDGDSFMDLGKLKEALPFYEKVMNKLPFQTQLHGLAALQWSICQDSLRRRTRLYATLVRVRVRGACRIRSIRSVHFDQSREKNLGKKRSVCGDLFREAAEL